MLLRRASNSFYFQASKFMFGDFIRCNSVSENRWKYGVRFYGNSSRTIRKSTVFALSTSVGISAIAVIRISGPDACQVPLRMTSFKNLPGSRQATLRKVRDPITNEVLDKSLLLWFPSPDSYTGEDMCELHIHGSVAVIRTILKALAKLPSFQHAEAGEFTKRAFLAGKLDLTEIEGLADLLHAQTEAQQRQALMQMDGHLYKLYTQWTEQIKNLLARIEAYIDFGEDQNLEDNIHELVTEDIKVLRKTMIPYISGQQRYEQLKNGLKVVLVGKPNVGKSSLINCLCQRDLAIVSPIPGTTRDIVETSINLGGYLVHLSDTAGLRTSGDSVESEGVRRAWKKLSEADLVLFVVDVQHILPMKSSHRINDEKAFLESLFHSEFMDQYKDKETDKQNFLQMTKLLDRRNFIVVLNKIDMVSEKEVSILNHISSSNVCIISCLNNSGIQELVSRLTEVVRDMFKVSAGDHITLIRERHQEHIQNCLDYLTAYCNNAEDDVAISAEWLRKAAQELGKITGRITTEDILDIIFRDFCIGK